jgi:hypothetical protein
VIHGAKLEVIDRATLASVGTLDLGKLANVTMYAQDARLVVVGTATATSGTEVRVYDTTSGSLPTLVGTRSYPAAPLETHSVGGRLVLVFQTYLPIDDTSVRLDGDRVAGGTRCTSILKQTVRDFDYRLSRVIAIDTTKPELPEQETAVLGGGDQIYMSETALYVAKSRTQWYWWAPDQGAAIREQMVVTKIALVGEDGAPALRPLAAGSIAGRAKDQWAFKELAGQGALAVATTTGWVGRGSGEPAQNHLWILRGNPATQTLETVAAVHDFGTNEDIRAVRYVGNTAYVVTFEKTDPLFAIDLTNALEPKLLGELVIPGFSVYLHPVPGDLLVGVGFDAADQGDFSWLQGVQVSLFDVKDPLRLERIDNKILGTRGSSSEVTSDHHAFYFNPESRLMAVPVVELAGGEPGTSQYGKGVAFSGAVLYRVDRTLDEVARVSHVDLMPDACRQRLSEGRWWQDGGASLDVNRVLELDGRLLTVSRYGVKAHDPAAPATVASTLRFTPEPNDCWRYDGYPY